MKSMQPERHTGFDLPAPDEASAAHSRRVAEYICQRIKEEGGSISFAEFMQHALYAPGLGYYVSGTTKFGRDGDFITAPEISPLFGQVLAKQAAAVLEQVDDGQIFELGAGSGVLAATILRKLSMLNALPDRYYILEVSADLRQRQAEYLSTEVPDLAARVEWLPELPVDFPGVIVANEVADALPVERFTMDGGQPKQIRVAVENGEFQWHQGDAPDLLGKAVDGIEKKIGRQFPDNYQSEICLALTPWINDLVNCLREGLIFLFDYGVTCREYYAPDRSEGWIRCHFRHHAHNNPLILPGIQDLTAWVDFSALADAAVDNGAEIAGYVSQAYFLINGGLQEELADFTSLPVAEQLELSRQTKLLTLPGEMGENFKCIGLSRGDIAPPVAFHESDRTHML
jgi:SAM-dependent MidA family methyltransferase